MTVYTAPGGWKAELVTLSHVAKTRPGTRDGHNDSAGPGQQWRVSQYGMHTGYARTTQQLAALVGEEAFAALIAEEERTALEMSGRLGRGEITLARYDAVTGPLDKRLAEHRAALERLDAPPLVRVPGESAAAWAARWDAASTDERRDLLRLALHGQVLLVGPPDPADPADVTRRLTLADPTQ